MRSPPSGFATSMGRSATRSAELGGQLLQDVKEALAIFFADDAIQIAVVLGRAFAEMAQRALAGRGQAKLITTSVPPKAGAGNEAAPHQIVQRRGEGRLVPRVGAAERRLADAGIAADQHQQGKAAGTEGGLHGPARAGAGRGR